eukprot:1151274-Pelagomonas_calceolata.AAC.2
MAVRSKRTLIQITDHLTHLNVTAALFLVTSWFRLAKPSMCKYEQSSPAHNGCSALMLRKIPIDTTPKDWLAMVCAQSWDDSLCMVPAPGSRGKGISLAYYGCKKPLFRRLGVGKLLLALCDEAAKVAGKESVSLHVRQASTPACPWASACEVAVKQKDPTPAAPMPGGAAAAGHSRYCFCCVCMCARVHECVRVVLCKGVQSRGCATAPANWSSFCRVALSFQRSFLSVDIQSDHPPTLSGVILLAQTQNKLQRKTRKEKEGRAVQQAIWLEAVIKGRTEIPTGAPNLATLRVEAGPHTQSGPRFTLLGLTSWHFLGPLLSNCKSRQKEGMGELAGCMQSFAIQLKCSDEGFNFCVQGDTPANQLYFSYGYVEQARDNIIAAKPCGVSACMHSCCSTWTFLDGVLGNGCPSRAAWCNDRLFKSPPTGCIGCPLPCNSEVLQCSLTVGMSLLQITEYECSIVMGRGTAAFLLHCNSCSTTLIFIHQHDH